MIPFIVFALPRSQTAWTSCFLTVGEVQCLHEAFAPGVTAAQVADQIRAHRGAHGGICDPGALLHWRGLVQHLPGARIAFIQRPRWECQQALAKAAGVTPQAMAEGFDRLEGASNNMLRICNPLTFTVDSLRTEAGARALWGHVCPNYPLPPSHLQKMLSLHIEARQELIVQSVAAAAIKRNGGHQKA